jgi:hypothetical protein
MCKTWASNVGMVPLGATRSSHGVDHIAGVPGGHAHRPVMAGRSGWCPEAGAAHLVPVSDTASSAAVVTLRHASA